MQGAEIYLEISHWNCLHLFGLLRLILFDSFLILMIFNGYTLDSSQSSMLLFFQFRGQTLIRISKGTPRNATPPGK